MTQDARYAVVQQTACFPPPGCAKERRWCNTNSTGTASRSQGAATRVLLPAGRQASLQSFRHAAPTQVLHTCLCEAGRWSPHWPKQTGALPCCVQAGPRTGEGALDVLVDLLRCRPADDRGRELARGALLHCSHGFCGDLAGPDRPRPGRSAHPVPPRVYAPLVTRATPPSPLASCLDCCRGSQALPACPPSRSVHELRQHRKLHLVQWEAIATPDQALQVLCKRQALLFVCILSFQSVEARLKARHRPASTTRRSNHCLRDSAWASACRDASSQNSPHV